MNIDIGAIFSRSFQILFQNRVLWALGFVLTLIGGGLNFNLNSGNYNFRSLTSGSDADMGSGILAATAGTGCLSIIITIICFLLRPVFVAALIYAADQTNQGQAPSFNAAFTAGRTWMWRVLGLSLILVLIGLILAVIFGGLALLLMGAAAGSIFTTISSSFAQPGATPQPFDPTLVSAALGGMLLLFCLGILVLIPVAFVLNTILELGSRAIVLENYPVGRAWSRGWRLLRANLGSAIILTLVQIGILIVVGIIGSIVGAIVGIPLVVFFLNSTVGLSLSFVIAIITAIVIWLLISLVGALPTAWNTTLWTLFYRAITGPAPQPAGYPGGPGYPGGYPGQQPTSGGYPGQAQYPGGYAPAPPPPTQGGYTQPGQYPGGYGQPPPAQGGYTQPGQYPGSYGQPPPAQGGYTQPGQYPGGYAPPPAQGGYTQPEQYPGGYAPPPPAQGIYNPPDQYPGGYAPPSDNPTQTFRPSDAGDDRARGGPGPGGQ